MRSLLTTSRPGVWARSVIYMLGSPLESHRTSSSPLRLSKYMTATAGRPESPIPSGSPPLRPKSAQPRTTPSSATAPTATHGHGNLLGASIGTAGRELRGRAQSRRGLVKHRTQALGNALLLKRRAPGDHFVEKDAEREDVAP